MADFKSLQLPLPLIQSVSLDVTGTWWWVVAKTPPERLKFGDGPPTKGHLIRVADAKASDDWTVFLAEQFQSWSALPDRKRWIGTTSGILGISDLGSRSGVRKAATHPLVVFTRSPQTAFLMHDGALEVGDAAALMSMSPLVLGHESAPPHSVALLDNEQTVAVVCERQAVFYRGGAREEGK